MASPQRVGLYENPSSRSIGSVGIEGGFLSGLLYGRAVLCENTCVRRGSRSFTRVERTQKNALYNFPKRYGQHITSGAR